MKLNYDNLEDASSKLVGTYCLYKGKAITVKVISEVAENTFLFTASSMRDNKTVTGGIDEPEFNCSDYNIGYVNRLTAATWFYRMPYKQYKQGLKQDQLGKVASSLEFSNVEFKHSAVVANMLENKYPTFTHALKALDDKEAKIMAFHKNFAATFDPLHEDYIIEYKGNKVGHTTNYGRGVKLLPEWEYILESLKEAQNA